LDGSTNITVDGTTYKGGTRKDVILIKTISGTETKMCPWTCIKSHKHDSSLTTTSQTWSNYWSADGGYWTQIATQVLLAKDAYIDLISSQGIRIYNDDGDIVGALSDASTKFQGVDILLPFWLNGILDASTGAFDTNPKFGIGADGTIYSGGISTGARIIIDPENKNILVKGTDGTNLVCIDGKKHSISDIISGLSENLTQQSALSSDDITSNTTVELGSVTMPSESGSYKVSMNTSLNTVTVTYIQSVISSSTVGGSSTNVYAQIVSSITATLIAYTKSGTTETIIDSVSVTASGAKSSSVTTTGATLYQANNRLELTLDSVTAQQKYYFRVEYVITHSSAKSSVTGSTYSTSSYSTFAKNYAIDYNKFTPLNEGVVSYLMGNGLLLGSSTNNYLSSGIENGKYVTKAISDGYGLQVTPNGLQIAIGGNSHWQAMPITLVAGKLDMRNCTWVVNSAHCCISATATEPTLEHYKDGDELSSVEIKNISALAGLTSSTFDERNVVVQATLAEPYDVSSVQPATVIARYDANRDSVIVACYDINYIKTTYTNIYIEVKYYPNVIR
jgi:hypothetical protein